jgi:hypothetical protein
VRAEHRLVRTLTRAETTPPFAENTLDGLAARLYAAVTLCPAERTSGDRRAL